MTENTEDAERDWLEAELEDSLDEDYEIELEDAVLSQEIKKIYQNKHKDSCRVRSISAICCAFNPN